VELDLYQLYSTKFSLASQCSRTSLPELTTRLTEEAADIRTTTQQMKAVRRFRCSIKTLDIACRISGSWRNSSAMTMTSASARMTVVAAIVPTSSGPLQHCLAQTETCNIASKHKEQQERYVPSCIQCGGTDRLSEVLLAAGEGLYSTVFVCLVILSVPGLYGMKKNTEHWGDEN